MEQQIKTTEVLKSILDNVTMKNTSLLRKWWFEVSHCGDRENPGWFVTLNFERPDTQTGKMGIGKGRAEFIRFGSFETGAVKTAWLLFELLIRHELMEAVRYNNCRIFNPHHTVSELMTLEKEHTL